MSSQLGAAAMVILLFDMSDGRDLNTSFFTEVLGMKISPAAMIPSSSPSKIAVLSLSSFGFILILTFLCGDTLYVFAASAF